MEALPLDGLLAIGMGNYRSFDSAGFILEDIKKINVLIGTNNCGKSNILRALRLLRRIDRPSMPQEKGGLDLDLIIDSHGRDGRSPCVIVELPAESVIRQQGGWGNRFCRAIAGRLRIKWNTKTGAGEFLTSLEGVPESDLSKMYMHLLEVRGNMPAREEAATNLATHFVPKAIQSLQSFKSIVCIENFREIRRNGATASAVDEFNGYDVIEQLRKKQHPKIGAEDQRQVFDRIETFVRDLLGEPALALEVPTEESALYIDTRRRRLPLESYGTGVHQLVILCAALAIHEHCVICIEEPEIHFHPDLQRKFIQFIANHTTNNYFVTTHSNVFLDCRPDVVAVYHVQHDGVKSTVAKINATTAARTLLADLGYKASDLLQANCVIWVEGPSDRIYLKKWIGLIGPSLVEGLHYSIAFYGGKCLAHIACTDDPANDFVQVLRINQHAIVLMDRDTLLKNDRLNATKERILQELPQSQCWVTQGREIENYLHSELVSNWLSGAAGRSVTCEISADKPIDQAVQEALSDVDRRLTYSDAKVKYARELCDQMTEAHLDVLDLRERLNEVLRLIHVWNHINVPKA